MRSVEKPSAFGWRGATTGVQFSEQFVANGRDAAIAKVADWLRNQPQQNATEPPEATEQQENATDSSGMSPDASIVSQHDRGQVLPQFGGQQLFGSRSLQRRQQKATLSIALKDPVDGMIAEAADTVVKDQTAGIEILHVSYLR